MANDQEKRKPGAILYTIEVLYKQGNKVQRWAINNQTPGEFMKFREAIFTAGFAAPVDPGHGYIIPPWDIVEITYEKQSKFFE
jgi:hypothetical protein